MPDKFNGQDPKTIWQNQSAENSTMTLEQLRQRARELNAKTRRQLLGTLTVPVVITLFYAFAVRQFPSLQEVLHPLFGCALVWSLVGLYFLNRGKWSEAVPAEAGCSAGIEFYRREIERRRDYLRGALVWSLGPVILAIATFIMAMAIVTGKKMFSNAMPFMMLVVAWVAVCFVIRARERRHLQREIDTLRKIGWE